MPLTSSSYSVWSKWFPYFTDTEFQLNNILFFEPNFSSVNNVTGIDSILLMCRPNLRSFKNAEMQVRFHVKWRIQFKVLNESETVHIFIKLSNIKFNGDPFRVFRVDKLSINIKNVRPCVKTASSPRLTYICLLSMHSDVDLPKIFHNTKNEKTR